MTYRAGTLRSPHRVRADGGLIGRALKCLQRGPKGYQDAIDALAEALRIEPRASAARLMRAEIYERRTAFDAALADALQALAYDASLVAAHVRAARLLCRTKKSGTAEQHLVAAERIDSERLGVPLIRVGRGLLDYARGNVHAATEHWRACAGVEDAKGMLSAVSLLSAPPANAPSFAVTRFNLRLGDVSPDKELAAQHYAQVAPHVGSLPVEAQRYLETQLMALASDARSSAWPAAERALARLRDARATPQSGRRGPPVY